MKTCNVCLLEKPESEFLKWYAKCKKCVYKRNALYTKNSPRQQEYQKAYAKRRWAKKKRTMELPITNLWKKCKGDRALFTIEAKKLLTKLNEQDSQRYRDSADVPL